jgi:hypothetical protein
MRKNENNVRMNRHPMCTPRTEMTQDGRGETAGYAYKNYPAGEINPIHVKPV